MNEYWIAALKRIAIRRRKISKRFAEDDERLWQQLAWTAMLEDYVRFCMENPSPILEVYDDVE